MLGPSSSIDHRSMLQVAYLQIKSKCRYIYIVDTLNTNAMTRVTMHDLVLSFVFQLHTINMKGSFWIFPYPSTTYVEPSKPC